MANLKYIGKNILNHTLNVKKGNISGSAISTGSFGSLYVNDRIGLGISNPEAYSANGVTSMTIGGAYENRSNSGISVISSTSGYGALYFGDGTSAATYRGAVEYNHSDDSLKIWTSATTGTGRAITIDSSNNTTFGANIISVKANGVISGSSTSTGSFGRLTAAGNIHGTSFVGTNLYGTIGTAAQNSITSATSLTSVGTVTSGIWNSTFGATSNKSISGSWRGELSSSNMTVIGGGVSGSSSSTGSFGRVISKTLNATSNVDISGNLTVAGNYIVNGTTTFISSSQLEIGDNIIQVNSVNPLNYGGIHVRDKNSNETGSMVWDSANDYWVAGQSGSEYRVPLQSGTSNLTDNKVIIAQGSGRLESGNITDTGASISMTLPVTASSNLEVGGNISGSSTSTGSFGYLEIADSGGSPTVHLNEPAGGGGDSAVRMTEDGEFRGGFIKYDGSNNELRIGTHANNNRTVSDDINTIKITRNDGYPFFVVDNVYFRQYLIHEGDTDTYLRYQTDQVDLSAGGNIFEINTTSLSGSSTSLGSFGSVFTATHITASGNISASGTVYADNFQSTGGDSAGISFTDDFVLTGNMTASGDISGSSTSTGSFGRADIRTFKGDVTFESPAGNREDVAKFRVADSDANLILGNDTNNAGRFIPTVRGYQDTASDNGLYLISEIKASADSGTRAAIDINARRVDSAGNITTRPILSVKNYVTELLKLDASGNLEVTGNVSGSSTSLGSFGSVFTNTHITASGNLEVVGNISSSAASTG